MNALSLPRREGLGGPPAFAKAIDALKAARASIRPQRRMAVSAAAEKWRRVAALGNRVPWRNDVVPYMAEPMDQTTSRRFRAVAFVGPARTGKSEGLINNVVMHRVICQPRDVRIVAMDQKSAREFSISKLGAMINACPDVRERQLPGRSADAIHEKRFVGGMRVTIAWPVITQLSMVDIPDMLLTDYDRMPEDVDGEGAPFGLAMKRTETFGTLGMSVAESSPGRPILDESWRQPPDAPHLAPPCTGILALYNEGTRARWYWTCEGCASPFEPDFANLHYPKVGDPYQRGAAAVMVCPRCGSAHEPSRKTALNRGGRWLHEAADGSLVTIDEAVRETEIVSYWLKGGAAAYQSWASMVGKYLSALEAFERTGAEESLKATVNTDQGLPYLPRTLGSAVDLSAEGLRAKPAPVETKVAPAWARFLTVACDVQGSRFVVQVDAWGEGLERVLIDRFDIHQPPATSPGADGRAIAPSIYAEDWDALLPLLERVYPVAGSAFGLKPAALISDSGGEPGVTTHAYAFWRRARKLGLKRRVFLARPLPGVDRQPRAVEREPEKVEQIRKTAAKGRPSKRIVHLVFAAVDVLKDEVATSLMRPTPGPGAYHLAHGLPDQVYGEFAAERRTPTGWEMKAGQRRNEALDCAVYGKALVIVLKAETIDWSRPPAWADVLASNAFAVPLETPPPAAANDTSPRQVENAPPIAARPRRTRGVRSGGI